MLTTSSGVNTKIFLSQKTHRKQDWTKWGEKPIKKKTSKNFTKLNKNKIKKNQKCEKMSGKQSKASSTNSILDWPTGHLNQMIMIR